MNYIIMNTMILL